MAGIYVHIPFCKKKCNYCNFFSLASEKFIIPYLGALRNEIKLQRDYLGSEIIETIYFGGGTPSLLSINQLYSILQDIFKYHNIANNCEITIEINPENINSQYLVELLKLGFNRLSIGIQSFFDDDLKYLDRNHNSEQVFNVINNSKMAGFTNLSIDLIYGIPTLTDDRWRFNIEKALELDIPHISAYCLTIENKTPLDLYIKQSKLKAPFEDLAIVHMELLMEFMKANNYIHYEISNFCKEGFFSKHNSNYWKQKKYLGLGPSAHSYNGISRQWNVSQITKYINSLNSNLLDFEFELISDYQRYNEYILTGLRTVWGIDTERVKNDFGKNLYIGLMNNIKKLLKSELIEMNGNNIKLTKKGILFADKIALDLFAD